MFSSYIFTVYNCYSKGLLLKDTAHKLVASIPPTCAFLYNTTSKLATNYLTSNTNQSLFMDELECKAHNMSSYYESFKNLAYKINSSPWMGAIKAILIFKQTVDTYIAYNQWTKGSRSLKSLIYHTSHLLIACVPILLSQTIIGQTWEGQIILNLCMLSSLTYSITQDLIPTRWRMSNQEKSSPASKLIQSSASSAISRCSAFLVSRKLNF